MTGEEPGSLGETPSTANREYADRLLRLQGKRWKKILNVQAPWKAHIRYLKLGRTLDIGCGNGRNMHSLAAGSVGVDHNPYSVEAARAEGFEAYTVDEFFGDPALSAPGAFDSLLAAHLIEHLEPGHARELMSSYLPSARQGSRVVFITPQERGFASDSTHVSFTGFTELEQLSTDLGLETVKHYSFPFPRPVGRVFTYNEFVHIARVPQAAPR